MITIRRSIAAAGAAACAVAITAVPHATSAAADDISAATHAAGFTHSKVYKFPGSTLPPEWGVYDSQGKMSTGDTRIPSYVSVSNNQLHLKASGDDGSGVCLCDNGASPSTPYGRWDVYARAPIDPNHGFAILTWPNTQKPNPYEEIDLAEFPGPDKKVLQHTVHLGPGKNKHSKFVNGNFSGFHKYSTIWTKNSLSFWVDNKLTWQTPDPSYSPKDAMHLVLQAGIYSKTRPTTGTSQMDVAAVRYFK